MVRGPFVPARSVFFFLHATPLQRFALVALLLSWVAVHATTYHIALDGLATNPGSLVSPWNITALKVIPSGYSSHPLTSLLKDATGG